MLASPASARLASLFLEDKPPLTVHWLRFFLQRQANIIPTLLDGLILCCLRRPGMGRPGSNTLLAHYHLLRKLGSQNLMFFYGRRHGQ
jgi:hypothetical protein